MVDKDRCHGSCYTCNNLSDKLCVLSKAQEVILKVFKTIIGLSKSKLLVKHISCDCKCILDGKECDSKQKCNTGKCQCEYKKNYIWNPSICACECEYLNL